MLCAIIVSQKDKPTKLMATHYSFLMIKLVQPWHRLCIYFVMTSIHSTIQGASHERQ